MDGALKPNEFLDNVKVIHKEEDIDNLVINRSTILFSGKSSLFSMTSMKKPKKIKSFSSFITAITLNSSGSKIAVALADETVVILSSKTLKEVFTFKEKCITSMSFQGDSLVYTTGSQNFSATQWQHDLLSNGSSGTVSANQLDGSELSLIHI